MQSKYFAIHELVPKHIFEKKNFTAWNYIRPELIAVIDRLKEQFPNGTMTINNYYWGGSYNYSGLRTPESVHFSETSMHSFGGAVDIKYSEYSTEDVRQYIIVNPEEYPEVKGIELGTAWLHIDCRNSDKVVMFEA